MNYFKITIGIFFILAASRFAPHPPNFTSLIALSFYVPVLMGRKFIPAVILGFLGVYSSKSFISLICGIMFDTGCSCSEIVGLSNEDVNLNKYNPYLVRVNNPTRAISGGFL